MGKTLTLILLRMSAASLHTFYLIRNSFVLGKKGGGGGW